MQAAARRFGIAGPSHFAASSSSSRCGAPEARRDPQVQPAPPEPKAPDLAGLPRAGVWPVAGAVTPSWNVAPAGEVLAGLERAAR
ncbi:hypothetical protein ASC99_35580 [Kitasatospora sp. Root107]|nr:hypothetical protein ASC99_35580 [Kitasatospora sp. Root107]